MLIIRVKVCIIDLIKHLVIAVKHHISIEHTTLALDPVCALIKVIVHLNSQRQCLYIFKVFIEYPLYPYSRCIIHVNVFPT